MRPPWPGLIEPRLWPFRPRGSPTLRTVGLEKVTLCPVSSLTLPVFISFRMHLFPPWLGPGRKTLYPITGAVSLENLEDRADSLLQFLIPLVLADALPRFQRKPLSSRRGALTGNTHSSPSLGPGWPLWVRVPLVRAKGRRGAAQSGASCSWARVTGPAVSMGFEHHGPCI